VGTTARGIVFGVIGVFLVVAAVTFDPAKAQGACRGVIGYGDESCPDCSYPSARGWPLLVHGYVPVERISRPIQRCCWHFTGSWQSPLSAGR
jgi:hypothetical protein